MARIASTPFLSYLIILTENYELALYGCVAAGISDVLDGHLARNYNMATVLGSYLDPLADKLFINVVSLSLWYADILPTPLICLWLARDVGLMGAAWYLYAGSITTIQVEPTTISKANTALQFLTLYVALLQPLHYIPPGALEAVWYVHACYIVCVYIVLCCLVFPFQPPTHTHTHSQPHTHIYSYCCTVVGSLESPQSPLAIPTLVVHR
jgi:cardiolipin synthase